MKYEKPYIEINYFDVKNIICTSLPTLDDGTGGDGGSTDGSEGGWNS